MALGLAVQNVSMAVVDHWQNGLGLQLASASWHRSSNLGPAGRRRPALVSGGLARSLARRCGGHHRLVATRIDAADLVPRVAV